MLKSYVGRTCPFCVTPIQEGVEVLICSICSKPHHSDCWMYNLDRCTTFGCKGIAQHPEFIIENLDPNNPQKTGTIKPSNFKPSQKTNATNTDRTGQNLLNSGPRSVRLNPMNMPGKKIPTAINSKNNSLQGKKSPKGINSIQKQQRKVPELTSYQSVPMPDPYIPDYVNQEFVKQESPPLPKRYIKPEIIPDVKSNTPNKNSTHPKPDFFIPDYVNSDLKSVPGWTPLGNGIKRTAISTFNYSNISEKPLEKTNYSSVPKPDPFIPDYVNGNLPLKSRSRKRISKYSKISPVKLPEIIYNKTEYHDSIPCPEPFIPDYVNAELPKIARSLFPKHIFSSIRCPDCSRNISPNSVICPFCKGLLNENTGNPISSLGLLENTSRIKPEIIIYSNNEIEFNTLFVNAKKIRSVCFSPDGRYISYGSSDTSVKVWDLFTKQFIKSFNEHNEAVTSVCFSPDGLYIASGSSDKTIKIWNLKLDTCIRTLIGNAMGVEAIIYSPDGKYIVSGSGYGTIKVWDIYSKICITTIETSSPSWLNTLSYNPYGPFVASGNSEPMINIWDVLLGVCVKSINGHFDFVNSVCYSPDGMYLVSGSKDRTVKLWDLANDKCLLNITGHEDIVNSVSYSPDGLYIASGSNDKTIKIWDVSAGSCVRNITGHTGNVNSVTYSPDGRLIASGSDDKTIRIWQIF